MPYIKETVQCGAVIEVRKYYSARYRRKDLCPRKDKAERTKEKQERINFKNSETKLRRILNANFRPDDLHISLTYNNQVCPPNDFEEAKKNMKLFMRKIKRRCQKAGVAVKAVYVNGVGKRSFHHHLVISKEAFPFIKECWKFGRPFFVQLDNSGDYSALASYLCKHFEKLKENGEGKKWHTVGQLVRPVPVKTVVSSNCYHERPKDIKGYYVDLSSVDSGIDEFSGYPYLRYRLIKMRI